jgi:shikimate kinase
MNIYLVGYMASGKSRLGKELSILTGLSFVDLDAVFEERYRIGIVDFFEKYGDKTFRQIEHKLLLETEMLSNTLIATGGGTSCTDENIRFIKTHGSSFYIRMSVKDLTSRLKTVRKKRPLLMNVPLAGLEAHIREQLVEREPYYLQADHVIDGPVGDLKTMANLIEGIIR